jgi:hypothetical protein
MLCRTRQDKCTRLITLYKHQISGLSESHCGVGHVSVFCHWVLSGFDWGLLESGVLRGLGFRCSRDVAF